jgi:hypothetical protein
VAFFSSKRSPLDEKYENYNQELRAMVRNLEQWKSKCEGSVQPMKILSDHKNLEYFLMSKHLNQRKTRWSEIISHFKFNILYRSDIQGQLPYALIRMPGDIPLTGQQEKHRILC